MRAALLLAALAAAPASAQRRASAAEAQKYATLRDNVDQAFLSAYLYKNGKNVSPASGKTRYVGAKIVRATGDTFFFRCVFYRLRDEAPNATSSPKGSIFLTTGLDRLKLTEAEQAAILAHEVGHLARAHWLARLQRNVQAAALAEYAGRRYGRDSAQISLLSSKLKGLQYDRDEEYEADALGAQLLLNAGYPPDAMISALAKLDADLKARGAATGGAFSDHPLTPDRIARLQALIPTLRAQRPRLRPLR